MPPNTPFFRFRLTDAVQQQILADQQGEEAQTAVEKALGKLEQAVQAGIESTPDRPAMYDGFMQLLMAGNALVYLDPEKGARIYRLPQYVVRRDPTGTPLEIITREQVDRASLPPAVLQSAEVREDADREQQNASGGPVEKTYGLYTYIRRTEKTWLVHQECLNQTVPGSQGKYPLDACPFIPLRMYRVDGEDYGRSYVEQFLGDLKSLEALSQAILEGSAQAAKMLWLVDPNSLTKASVIQNAPNGAVLEGRATDVTVVQSQKSADLRIAYESISRIEQRLAKAFLLVDGTRRDAERVTAEEIRAVANELETALGGIYSILSQEFQRPYIKVKLKQLEKKNALPALPKGAVEPSIVAGFEALGRGNDWQKLQELLGGISQFIPPQMAAQFINIPNLLTRCATAKGVNPEGLFKDHKAIQTEREQAQAQAQRQDMTKTMMPKAMDMLGQGMANMPPEMLQQAVEGIDPTMLQQAMGQTDPAAMQPPV